MNEGIKTTVYPVSNLAQAKALFSALLGVEPHTDAPYYVGFNLAGQEVGLDPNGHKQGMTGPVNYYHVDDLRATLASLVAAGATILQDVRNVGGDGKIIASVKDADGNVIGLLQMQS